MGRHIRVEAVRKEKPNYHLYMLALIALARQVQAADGGPKVADAGGSDERVEVSE